MITDKERFEELCSAYVLNALEGEELREFQQDLIEANPERRNIYDEMRWVALHLPLASEFVEPPSYVKENILRAIQTQPSPRAENMLGKAAKFFGLIKPQVALAVSLALLVIIVGLSYYTFFLREVVRQRDQQLTALQADLSLQRQQFIALQNELTRKEEFLKILQSPKIDVVIMGGLEISPTGYGKIIWDPERKSAILQISNLPPVPKDKDYQLWVIKGQKPVSAGVFSLTDPEKESFFKIDQLVEADKKVISAFAVTLEPKGGVPQPTGKMYLLGKPS